MPVLHDILVVAFDGQGLSVPALFGLVEIEECDLEAPYADGGTVDSPLEPEVQVHRSAHTQTDLGKFAV